jgi:hypothetical protein
MRVPFRPLEEVEFDLLFDVPKRGGGGAGGAGNQSVFSSRVYRQRGSGFLSVLGNLARRIFPFMSKYVIPAATTFGQNVLGDVSSGQQGNFRSSLKRHGLNALRQVGQSVLSGGGGGGGVKRKRSRCAINNNNKRRRKAPKRSVAKRPAQRRRRRRTRKQSKQKGKKCHFPVFD